MKLRGEGGTFGYVFSFALSVFFMLYITNVSTLFLLYKYTRLAIQMCHMNQPTSKYGTRQTRYKCSPCTTDGALFRFFKRIWLQIFNLSRVIPIFFLSNTFFVNVMTIWSNYKLSSVTGYKCQMELENKWSKFNLPISCVQIRPPILSLASKILNSVNPFFVRYSAAEMPAIPAPIIRIFVLIPPSWTSVAMFATLCTNQDQTDLSYNRFWERHKLHWLNTTSIYQTINCV